MGSNLHYVIPKPRPKVTQFALEILPRSENRDNGAIKKGDPKAALIS
jgi:hypothetical protein